MPDFGDGDMHHSLGRRKSLPTPLKQSMKEPRSTLTLHPTPCRIGSTLEDIARSRDARHCEADVPTGDSATDGDGFTRAMTSLNLFRGKDPAGLRP